MTRAVRIIGGALAWIAILLAMLAIIMAAACSPKPPPTPPLAGGHIARADALVEAAQPHVNEVGRPLLQTAHGELVLATVEVADGTKREAAKDYRLQEQDNRLAAYHDRWLGDKLIRTTRWVIGIAIAAWLGLSALTVAARIFLPGLGFALTDNLPLMGPARFLAGILGKGKS